MTSDKAKELNSRNVFYETPIESVYVLLDTDAEQEKHDHLLQFLCDVLPALNWRSHIYLLDKQGFHKTSVLHSIIEKISEFLKKHEIYIIYIHPLIQMDSNGELKIDRCRDFLKLAQPFQQSAYQDQSEVRLMIPPIIQPMASISPHVAMKAIAFFNSYCSIPSFYLKNKEAASIVNKVPSNEARFYVADSLEQEPEMGQQLWMNHIFETLIDRSDGDEGLFTQPCYRHLVIDQEEEAVFVCFMRSKDGFPDARLSDSKDDISKFIHSVSLPHSQCALCMGSALKSMKTNLIANRRRKEGREVYSKLAVSLSQKGEHRMAADIADLAYQLSDCDNERGLALIHKGLSYHKLREFELAEEALKKASAYAVDQGLVAYHRGQVQFDWRDYIEALDRFEEALKLGTDQIPLFDIYFQMALSHINIEEYDDARPYLNKCLSFEVEDKTVPVLFYLGVCDYGQGNWDGALGYFDKALQLNPSVDDLSRVLFYKGAGLKELDRFDEAIEVLEEACRTDPTDLANFNLLGFCYYKTKEHQKAVTCFQRAVIIDPRSAIDWANLGSNLRDLGRTDEAIEMYKKALSLDPTIGFARISLKKLLHQGEVDGSE